MITPEVPSFYIVQAVETAAEAIAAMFSPAAMSDIVEAVVVSRQFDNDIQPINEMDEALETIKLVLEQDINETSDFNPLYIPQPIERLDDVLEVEPRSDLVRFVGMDANPFVIKSTHVKSTQTDTNLITGIVRYQQFELPAYQEIIEQQTRVLN